MHCGGFPSTGSSTPQRRCDALTTPLRSLLSSRRIITLFFFISNLAFVASCLVDMCSAFRHTIRHCDEIASTLTFKNSVVTLDCFQCTRSRAQGCSAVDVCYAASSCPTCYNVLWQVRQLKRKSNESFHILQ